MNIFKNILLLALFMVIGAGVVIFTYKKSFQNVTSVVSNVPTTLRTSQFNIADAPSTSLRGIIASMSGEVNWQSRTATQSAKISTPIAIQQGEKLETGENSSVSVVFATAANITLSPKTSLDIIQTIPANIVFSQTKGSTQYTKTGSFPVSARVLHLLININGETNITINDKKPIVTIKGISGELTVAYNDLKNISQIVTVSKGKTFTFNDQTRKGVLK